MANLPLAFPIPTPSAIASYNYTDIATGTGFVTYYCAITTDSTGQDEILTPQVVFSDETNSTWVSPTGNGGDPFVKVGDLDFDLSTFNLPQTLKGTAVINGSFAVNTDGSVSCYIIFKIRHWDGTTETDIGSVQTETIDKNSPSFQTFLVEVSLTEKHFKKGETLRVTAEVWEQNIHNAAAGDVQLCHDPKDRTVALVTPAAGGTNFETSQLRIDIPYKLDI